MGGEGGSCGSDGSGRRKGEESRAEQERRFSGGGRREVSRGLVQVLPLHAAQDKEISRGANADTAACSRRVGGGEGPFHERIQFTLWQAAAQGHCVNFLSALESGE